MRYQGRAWWQRWLPVLVGLMLLAVAPLVARAQVPDSVRMAWTAPGDDDRVGTASVYDMRISSSPITEENFDAAQPVAGLPAPLVSGARQHFTIRGLDRATTYYIALRTQDDSGNWSGVSNLVRWDWTLDSAPPATPPTPAASREEGSVRISWPPSSDADLEGYNVYRSISSGGTYSKLNTTPVAEAEYLDANLPENASAVWYRVTAVDTHGNESSQSSSIAIALSPQVSSNGEWAIEPGYPNPSRAATPVRIPVVVPASASGNIVIDVLDSGGRLVRRIERAASPGTVEIEWDGKNDAGREVAPGVYRAWLGSGGSKRNIRLMRVP